MSITRGPLNAAATPEAHSISDTCGARAPWESCQHRGSSGPPEWSPLDLSPEIFAIIDDDYITQSGTISAVVNQGTIGGSFSQAVAGARPTYAADFFGTGKHAATFDGADELTLAGVSLSSTAWAMATGADETGPGFNFVWSLDGATYSYVGFWSSDLAPYAGHKTDAGDNITKGSADTSPHFIAANTDVSLAGASEVGLYVDGVADNASKEGLAANNAAALGTGTARWGSFNGSLYFFIGSARFVFAISRTLTAGEIASFNTWAASELGL
jgi:hypothetical protein